MDSELDPAVAEEDQKVMDLLAEEIKKWAEELEMTPEQAVHINAFILDCTVSSIVRLLIAKEIITEDEAARSYRQTMLESMRHYRSEITPLVQEARRKAIVGEKAPLLVPGIPTGLRRVH